MKKNKNELIAISIQVLPPLLVSLVIWFSHHSRNAFASATVREDCSLGTEIPATSSTAFCLIQWVSK